MRSSLLASAPRHRFAGPSVLCQGMTPSGLQSNFVGSAAGQTAENVAGSHAAAQVSASPEAAHEVEGLHAVEVEAKQQSLGHHAQTQGPGGILPAAQWAAVFGHAAASRRLLQDYLLLGGCRASANSAIRGRHLGQRLCLRSDSLKILRQAARSVWMRTQTGVPPALSELSHALPSIAHPKATQGRK